MDERRQDTLDKLCELEGFLTGNADAKALYEAATRGRMAMEFRAEDVVIGLEPVDPSLLSKLQVLTERILWKAAEAGHPKAQLEAAQVVWTNRDDTRAVEVRGFLKAIEDEPAAAYLLGLFSFHGFGCKKNLERSVSFHRRAAEHGSADAMFELYAMTSRGLGCRRDEAEALVWCRKAADANHARAMSNLAGFYATGLCVEKDMHQAVEWYERAALAGHGRAAATLGVMFALGQEVPRDDKEAKQYFDAAEDAGFDWREFAQRVGVDPDEYER